MYTRLGSCRELTIHALAFILDKNSTGIFYLTRSNALSKFTLKSLDFFEKFNPIVKKQSKFLHGFLVGIVSKFFTKTKVHFQSNCLHFNLSFKSKFKVKTQNKKDTFKCPFCSSTASIPFHVEYHLWSI